MRLNLFNMFLTVICILFLSNANAELTTDYILQNIRCHGSKGNFCDSIVCAALSGEDCPRGEIMPNSSFCNCCDACIETLDNGQSCESTIEGTLRNIIQPRCKTGLQCVNGMCAEINKTPCLKEQIFRRGLRVDLSEVFTRELWVPECEDNGSYSPIQTKKRRSFCVSKDGKRIFGQLSPIYSQNMTCGCSRYHDEMRGKVDFLSEAKVHCSSSGDYDEVQCIGDMCYCADPVSGAVKSRIVKMKYLEVLPCSWKKSSKGGKFNKGYIKPCEVEVIRIHKLKSYFRKKGISIEYTDPVKCDPDGTFNPVQCNPEICACTNIEGVGIGSYFVNKRDKPTNMTCSCARDTIHSDYLKLSCTGYGNNEPFHCYSDDICYCVDEDGDTISNELDLKLAKSICHKAVKALQTKDLKDFEGSVNTTSTTTAITTTDGTVSEETEDYEY